MQTFIPERTYEDCAAVLDRQRCGKQRVECLQIMNVLTGATATKGWRNHPAVLMWRGSEYALMQYAIAVCTAWTDRGYVDNCANKIRASFHYKYGRRPFDISRYPDWWGRDEVHESHRSNLLRKDFDFYSQFWPDVPDDIPYVWPTVTIL